MSLDPKALQAAHGVYMLVPDDGSPARSIEPGAAIRHPGKVLAVKGQRKVQQIRALLAKHAEAQRIGAEGIKALRADRETRQRASELEDALLDVLEIDTETWEPKA